ncbi:hypothetical protein ABTX81_23620 [Kitasatospora sp. NPDC097605]|uniref:hypothetical protein n=1 Tax=Kitasatospora sp. NPDC097605 TaxID=3157226 RepID=UPI00331DE7B4
MGEILVNTTTAGIQQQPAVAGLLQSHYLVAWQDASAFSVKGQFLRADGVRFREEFVVNEPGPDPQNTDRRFPAAASTGTGPVVVWTELAVNPPGPRPHVKLQRFDLEARKAGPEIRVSTDDVDPSQRPSVTSTIDGGCLVVWADARSDRRIRGQRFRPDGSKAGDEFTVNATDGFHENPLVKRLAGAHVVLWRRDPSAVAGGAMILRLLDFEGTPTTDELVPDLSGFRGDRAITLLDDGRFVIAHVRSLGPSDLGVERSTVVASVFRPNGTREASLSAVDGDGVNASSPALLQLPNHQFVLSWVQKSAETFTTVPTVRAKVFDADQGTVAGEIEVSDGTAEDRFQLAGASLLDPAVGPRALLAWADRGGAPTDPSDSAVRARALTLNPFGPLA